MRSNQLSPNLTFRDFWLGVSSLWEKPAYDWSQAFGTPNYLLLNAARSGLSLVARNLPPNSLIALPAFICAVVATPFLQYGHRIVWVDVDEHGLMDPSDLARKIAGCTAVVVPHIFGQRARMRELSELARANNVLIIEDCAHLWDTSFEYSDVKIFSFGREKVYSCVSGGALVWRDGLDFRANEVPAASKLWGFRHLLQIATFSLTLPWWEWGGRYIAGGVSKLGILPRAVTGAEKRGQEDFPCTKLSPCLEKILIHQWLTHEEVLKHRQEIAAAWQQLLERTFPGVEIIIPENALRVILKIGQPETIRRKARKLGFDLREWDGIPIAPRGVDLQAFGYEPGSCPVAENFVGNYLTFPTSKRMRLQDVEKFAKIVIS